MSRYSPSIVWVVAAAVGLAAFAGTGGARAAELELIRVSDDKQSFALAESGRKFVVWG
jgi:hypothetical protein